MQWILILISDNEIGQCFYGSEEQCETLANRIAPKLSLERVDDYTWENDNGISLNMVLAEPVNDWDA